MNRLTASAFFLLLGLALPPGAMAQSEHDHAHHEVGGLGALQLDHGQRWATDAPLRDGMQQIRDAFERRHAGFHDGSMSAQDYAQLAADLGRSIEQIFAHCKLPPAADAELHKLLAAIMGARAKLSEAEAEGMLELHRALLAYPKYFEHPGWPAG